MVYSEYGGEQSTFNEAVFQMDRINRLQSEINLCWTSPMTKEDRTGKYFYEIIFSNLKSLFSEVSSKLKDAEKTDGLDKIKDVQDFIIKHPIFVRGYNQTTYRKRIFVDFKEDNYHNLLDKLYALQLLIRKLLEEHDLTAPKKLNPSRAVEFG